MSASTSRRRHLRMPHAGRRSTSTKMRFTRERFASQGGTTLHRLHGQKRKVFYQPCFLLNERLGVAYSRKQTIVSRCGKGPFPDLFLGNKQSAARFPVCILRLVCYQGSVPILDMRGDV